MYDIFFMKGYEPQFTPKTFEIVAIGSVKAH